MLGDIMREIRLVHIFGEHLAVLDQHGAERMPALGHGSADQLEGAEHECAVNGGAGRVVGEGNRARGRAGGDGHEEKETGEENRSHGWMGRSSRRWARFGRAGYFTCSAPGSLMST